MKGVPAAADRCAVGTKCIEPGRHADRYDSEDGGIESRRLQRAMQQIVGTEEQTQSQTADLDTRYPKHVDWKTESRK